MAPLAHRRPSQIDCEEVFNSTDPWAPHCDVGNVNRLPASLATAVSGGGSAQGPERGSARLGLGSIIVRSAAPPGSGVLALPPEPPPPLSEEPILPTRLDPSGNRDLLLDAARDLVAEHGTETSLREIARHAGVGIGTLYRHFPSREALLEALLNANFERLRTQADTLLATSEPGAALLAWLAELASGAATYQGLPESIMNALADEGSLLHASCSQMRSAAGLLLKRAQEGGSIRADVTVGDVVALVLGLSWSGERAGEAPDLAARLLSIPTGVPAVC